MNAFITNIENETLSNENFRKVLYTGTYSQLAVMTLLPEEEIGEEIHPDVDQYIRIQTGVAKVIIDGEESVVGPDYIVLIPAGARHNVVNESVDENLRLYTIYTPPEHPKGTIHRSKEEGKKHEPSH